MPLPTIPSFSTGDTDVSKLQQLSECARFITVATFRPYWRFYSNTSTQSISATTWTQVQMPSVALDTDGTWTSPGTVTIQTQGYYTCAANVTFKGAGSSFLPTILFKWTAGINNPNYSSGTTKYFGGHASTASASMTGTDFALCIADECPVVCYYLDKITVMCYSSAACTIDYLTNTSRTAGWYAPEFSGRWIRTGS